MTQSQFYNSQKGSPATESSANCSRCGTWGWGGAFLAVIASGLFIGSQAWTERSEAGSQVSLIAPGASEARQPPKNLEVGEPGVLVGELVWQENYAAALAESRQQGKPVLVRFTATWCGPCQVMDAQIWPDKEVVRTLADRAIPVKIDVDEEAHVDVIRRYGIRAVPTLLVVDANGEELARGGFMSAEALVEFLQGT